MATRKELGSVKFLVNYQILSEKALRKKKLNSVMLHMSTT